MWQTYPFSMDLFIQAEKETAKKAARRAAEKKERKPKFKLALSW